MPKFDSINSPIPTDLAGECRKASKILNSFIDPGQGLDKIIPPNIIQNAKGLAIFTVIKAGFLFSGRAGSGLVVARLPDGSWSAPSAIGTGGMGVGGQIGAEITDFVVVLNNKEAVKTFSHGGSVTLGGNLSVAAGPIGRNAEASGAATLKHVAAIYSYSKTKGLFAGVSIEGSVIVERADANAKFYGQRITAKQLLSGSIPPPMQADLLYRSLNARISRLGTTAAMYDASHAHNENTNGSDDKNHDIAPPTYTPPSQMSNSAYNSTAHLYPVMSSSYPQQAAAAPLANAAVASLAQRQSLNGNGGLASINGSVKRPVPPIPPQKPKGVTAVALYDFTAEQETDLPFRKGDLILITKKTDTQNDWWEGTSNGRSGIFPANYVSLQ